MPNRLAQETSPYLLQHAENPVDWYPWGEEALQRARELDRPLLVSIGYSACHWCHVMERETFEDPEVAALMNEKLVCIKVDREERPDVDAVCMEACQAMTGQGGWPLNAFLTPEQAPFYVGTYFPPEPRHGMPPWRAVVEAVAEAWSERKDRVREQGAQVLRSLGGASRLPASEEPITDAVPTEAVETLRRLYDPVNGGFGRAPKFPQASLVEFLLARGERDMSLARCAPWPPAGSTTRSGAGLPATPSTPPGPCLTSRRCSMTTRCWLAPTCTAGRYLASRCCAASVRRRWTGRCGRCADPRAGSARRWTPTPRAWRASSTCGRWPNCAPRWRARDCWRRRWRSSAPARPGTSRAPTCSRAAGRCPERLAEIQAVLLAVRGRRVRPGLDDKRLTSWNALMISALAQAGAALERADYVAAAVACAEFLLRDMRDADGRLLRTWKDGRAHIDAYLEDHAYLLEALVTLYEATFDPRWHAEAQAIADTMIERFADAEDGGFFTTAADHREGFARQKDLDDSPTPSGGASAAFGLLRLARLTGEFQYERHALEVLRVRAAIVGEHPHGFGHVLQALDFYLAPVREVAIVGAGDDDGGVARWRGSCGAPTGRTWCWPAVRATASRCSRAGWRWMDARRRTCVSTSPARPR